MSVANLLTNQAKTWQNLKVNSIDAKLLLKADLIEATSNRIEMKTPLVFQKAVYNLDLSGGNTVNITTQCGTVNVTNVTNPLLVDGGQVINLDASNDLISASNTLCITCGGVNNTASVNFLTTGLRGIVDGRVTLEYRNHATVNYTGTVFSFTYLLL